MQIQDRHTKQAETATVGTVGKGHLGDSLCSTPLPRKLVTEHKKTVWVPDRPILRCVFADNPYVAGFVPEANGEVPCPVRGFGHLIQRMQQGIGLRYETIPRPELYLTQEERDWAGQERARWPSDRPACIFSGRVITDAPHFARVDWRAVGETLAERFTIIQPILTSHEPYQQQIDPKQPADSWRDDPILPNAIQYKDLPLRRYLSLFSVADGYCGGTSGGAHAAATFDVPSLIVGWRALLSKLRFPVSDPGLPTSVFLYPNHMFIAAEDLYEGAVRYDRLTAAADRLAEQARKPRSATTNATLLLTARFQPPARNCRVRSGNGRICSIRQPT